MLRQYTEGKKSHYNKWVKFNHYHGCKNENENIFPSLRNGIYSFAKVDNTFLTFSDTRGYVIKIHVCLFVFKGS